MNSKIYDVKINESDIVVLFLLKEWEYPVKFKNTSEVKEKIEEAKQKLERGEHFFVRNLSDYYWKLKTPEQLTEEEKNRTKNYPEGNWE